MLVGNLGKLQNFRRACWRRLDGILMPCCLGGDTRAQISHSLLAGQARKTCASGLFRLAFCATITFSSGRHPAIILVLLKALGFRSAGMFAMLSKLNAAQGRRMHMKYAPTHKHMTSVTHTHYGLVRMCKRKHVHPHRHAFRAHARWIRV